MSELKCMLSVLVFMGVVAVFVVLLAKCSKDDNVENKRGISDIHKDKMHQRDIMDELQKESDARYEEEMWKLQWGDD